MENRYTQMKKFLALAENQKVRLPKSDVENINPILSTHPFPGQSSKGRDA